ncbi:MAG: S8 family serine peptidase [Bacteroidota bacterium]
MVALLLVVPARAQQKYWVFFADKAGVEFQPRQYFHPRAIARRQREGIPLNHFTDRPVRKDYLEQVGGLVDTVRHASRWFNAVAVWAHPKQIRQVAALPFVMATEAMPVQQATLSQVPEVPPADADILTNLTIGQIARMGGEHFDSLKVNGAGVRVAIFDAGFPGTDTHPALQHVRLRNGIKETYDFVRDRSDVYRANSHGTSVMSNIAGIRNGQKMGLATGADFLLARTETGWHERFSEEENWVAALEWADRYGAEVVNSSLGYTNARYFPRDMNGRKSLIARAANMAAAKGIVVVNSAGNEGNNPWKVIGSPADADSILSVGGLAPWSDSHIGFSSYGPTADKRLKPNVCAYGRAAVAGKKATNRLMGPLLQARLWQGLWRAPASCSQTWPACNSCARWSAPETFTRILTMRMAMGCRRPIASWLNGPNRKPPLTWSKKGTP